MVSSNSSNRNPGKFTRRQFIYTTALATSAAALAGCATARPRRISANEKLNIGAIGCGGKGDSDIQCCSSENIVALCDVDAGTAEKRRAQHPNAKVYKDFREMLEKEKSLDAVIVSTPDHMHAVAAATAIKMGKHVYCQKPLTHDVYEARTLRALAKKYNVATQMGNQGSANDGLRRAVEIVQAGVIGPVRQVYVWSNRPIWPQGMDRPPGSDPVPANLDWDLWLGTAPWRPYKGNRTYHDFNWRGWQDYGTGALGDMACHTANLPFRALKLGYPTEIEAETPPMNRESYPLKSKIRFEFPAREGLVPVTFWWFDGGNPQPRRPFEHDRSNKPPKEITADVAAVMDRVPDSGCLLIGDNGKLFSDDDYGARSFIKVGGDKEMTLMTSHAAVKAVPQTIERNTFQGDGDLRHHQEWIAACKGGKPAYSNFDIAAYLTEIILLGCVAMRVGKKLEWDGPNMRAKNAPEAAQYVRRVYRKGWSL